MMKATGENILLHTEATGHHHGKLRQEGRKPVRQAKKHEVKGINNTKTKGIFYAIKVYAPLILT